MTNPYADLRHSLGRPLFVPFMVLGDPNPSESLDLIQTLIDNGADALELGMPFSDPPADGPVIQAADTRALEHGVRIDDCFAILKDVHAYAPHVPIGLLIYYNLIVQRGIDQFYSDCKAAGVASVLVADLPLEHMEEVHAIAQEHDIAPVCIISELTPDDRIAEIARIADGYIYIVSYLGVTGVEDAVMESKVRETIDRVRKHTDLPLIVGFGINTPDHVRSTVAAGADGVIVASRLVREVPDREKIGELCRELRESIAM